MIGWQKQWFVMHFREIVVATLLCSLAFGNVEDVEFLADKVEKNADIIKATGNVLLYSQHYLVTANRAVYDQKNEIIELFGNVNMLRDENETSRSNYAKIDLKTNKVNFDSNFAIDKSKELWIVSKNSCSTDEAYNVNDSIVSSCNVQNPDWHIKFSSGELNKKSKFLSLYNPVFYIGDYPVFYLPYFGFSTDKTRRSGLLTPQIAFGGSNGLMYLQPIYIATSDEWDLEFDPQIRTNRGLGIYSTFRFADSPYSNGLIRTGIFSDRRSYKEKEGLKNQNHKGIEVEYDRGKLVKYLIDGDFSEGLWLRYISLNDIDYLNLRGKKDGDYDSLVQSKFNYFITSKEHYLGAYAKYYIDTAKIGSPYGNKDTIQELPTLQYHSFLSSFLINNLTYSFDAKYHNYARSVGVSADQYEMSIPVGLNFSFLDDILNFSVTENLYATHINYKKNEIYNNGKFFDDKYSDYMNLYHKFTLQTDLAKAYDGFYHTLNLKLDYVKPGYTSGKISEKILKPYMIENKNNYVGSLDDDFFEDNFLSVFDKDYSTQNLSLNLTEYFYDNDGRKLLRHSIKQGYNLDSDEINNLENRINLYLANFTLSNKIEYSYLDNYISKFQSGIGYSNNKWQASIWQTFEKQNKKGDLYYDRENFISTYFSANLPQNYRLFAGFDYDLQRSYSKMWKTGISYKRKCWDYTFVYKQDIEPKNTSAGLESKKTQGVYLYFSFYPLGGVGYNFSIEQKNEIE